MTPAQVSLLIGASTVATIWCVTRTFRTATTSVADIYRRLYHPAHARATEPTGALRSVVERLAAAYAGSRSGERLEQRRRYALRTAGITLAGIITRAITTAVVVYVAAAIAAGTSTATADVFPTWFTITAPFAAGLIAGWYHVAVQVAAAEAKHRQFRIDAGAYVSLVAVCMTTQRTTTESITYAASIGTGHAFGVINDAVRAAPQMGLRVAEAIESVGVEYGCRELEDLASSISHVTGIGVAVETTVTAIATRMRQTALDEMQVTADKRTSAMFGPTMLFVAGVVAFLAYPLAVRVLDALSISPT